mmetsp:Transcript_39600/g.84410  ORF Transcript_39600/g.84410 Transcript_39600/m.84410 type:complete len:215 (-) Transcript_39600:805-1449(-)
MLQASATCCTKKRLHRRIPFKVEGVPISVHLNMVALILLHLLGELLPINSVLLRNGAEALLHAGLHALEAAHVDVRLRRLHELPELVTVLRHLGLDVHLLSCCVLLLPGDSVVKAELARVLGHVLRVLVVIKQRLGEGHAHEEPSETLELPRTIPVRARLVMEEIAHVRAHGCDASSRRQHDDVVGRVLWQQHLRTSGAGNEHLIADAHVVDVV